LGEGDGGGEVASSSGSVGMVNAFMGWSLVSVKGGRVVVPLVGAVVLALVAADGTVMDVIAGVGCSSWAFFAAWSRVSSTV